MICQRDYAFWQRLRFCVSRQRRPARCTVAVNGGRAQVVGKCRPQGLFITGFYRQQVHDLTALGGVAIDKVCKCGNFGFKGFHLAISRRPFGAGIGLARLCGFAGVVNGDQSRFGDAGGLRGVGECGSRRRKSVACSRQIAGSTFSFAAGL